jgi:hypothetical protein
MPRSLEEILEHAEELQRSFAEHDPTEGHDAAPLHAIRDAVTERAATELRVPKRSPRPPGGRVLVGHRWDARHLRRGSPQALRRPNCQDRLTDPVSDHMAIGFRTLPRGFRNRGQQRAAAR